MPRPKRVCPAGKVFHVLNRAVARMTNCEKPEDYDAFLRVLDETWTAWEEEATSAARAAASTLGTLLAPSGIAFKDEARSITGHAGCATAAARGQ